MLSDDSSFFIFACLLGVNLVTFIRFGKDKHFARRHAWCIPETTLLVPLFLMLHLFL